MVHFSCDLCGQDVHPTKDQRYVVKVEGYPVDDQSLLSDDDLDEDHFEQVSELLQEIDHSDHLELDDDCKTFRFDLCSECYKKFLRDPLGKEMVHRFDFSEN